MRQIRNQPSDEALIKMMHYLLKTSVPRILAAEEQKKIKKDTKTEKQDDQ